MTTFSDDLTSIDEALPGGVANALGEMVVYALSLAIQREVEAIGDTLNESFGESYGWQYDSFQVQFDGTTGVVTITVSPVTEDDAE